MQRFFSVILLLLLLSAAGNAQWLTDSTFISQTSTGIAKVYNLEFEAARSQFQAIVSKYPDHPAGHFLLAMVSWWEILIDIENRTNDDRFIGMLEKVIDLCDRRLEKDENDIAALFFKGGALGFRGRLYSHREDWVLAANDGRRALPIVEKCFAIAPENYDVLLGEGIYNYYAEVVPERYPFVKPLMVFFPDGDRDLGIRQLREASAHALYAGVEATYFLMQLYYTYEKDFSEARKLAEDLHARFPANVVFHRYLGRCEAALNNWESAAKVFEEIRLKAKRAGAGYGASSEREACYYLGSSHMMSSRLPEALHEFYACDSLSRALDTSGPSGFMTMTNLRIGMVYDLQSRREEAILQYRKVLGMKDYQTAHSLAERYISQPYGKN